MSVFERTEGLIGKDRANRLKSAFVAVFGVGGVGGFVVESLVRSGIGNIALIDSDRVESSNLNRQIVATTSTIGKLKTEIACERAKEINPNINVKRYDLFYLPENADEIDFSAFDYVVDAVDTVSAKVEIIRRAIKTGVPVISCMGTAGKLEPTALRVAPLSQTKVCPLAKAVRRQLSDVDLSNVKAVYSEEKITAQAITENGKHTPPSMIFVPATAGIILANEVIKDLIK